MDGNWGTRRQSPPSSTVECVAAPNGEGPGARLSRDKQRSTEALRFLPPSVPLHYLARQRTEHPRLANGATLKKDNSPGGGNGTPWTTYLSRGWHDNKLNPAKANLYHYLRPGGAEVHKKQKITRGGCCQKGGPFSSAHHAELDLALEEQRRNHKPREHLHTFRVTQQGSFDTRKFVVFLARGVHAKKKQPGRTDLNQHGTNEQARQDFMARLQLPERGQRFGRKMVLVLVCFVLGPESHHMTKHL